MNHPFGDNMQPYWDNGLSPLPTQIDGKAPAITGVTGKNAKPDYWKLKEIEVKLGHRNLAITGQIHRNGVLDESQSIITVDNDDETGVAVENLQREIGVPLPATLTVTARGANNPRRKYLYRVKGSRHNFKGNVCDGKIDICSDTLRCVVMEGTHKTSGLPIVVYGEDGTPLGRIPKLSDIAWAPDELVNFLTKTAVNSKAKNDATDDNHSKYTVTEFESALDSREPTEWVSDLLVRIQEDTRFGNQKLFEHLVSLVDLCNLWERGTSNALAALKNAWFNRDHNSGNPSKEWDHALENAVSQHWHGPSGKSEYSLRELALRWETELVELQKGKTLEVRLFEAGGSRPLFQQVMRVAEITGDNPAALLIAVLAQISFEIPWDVYFESDLGLDPLNLMVVLIGPSGAGKSIITQHAEDPRFFVYPRLRPYIGPSDAVSGEGLLTGLVARYPLGKGKFMHDWRDVQRNKLYNIDEIGMLEARSSRQGSTIRETMLSLHSGSPISRESASGENWSKPKNSYRVVFQIGAQPRRSDIFFNDDAIAAGFAGRCLWAPVTRESDLEFKEHDQIDPLYIRLPDWDSWLHNRTYRATRDLAEEIWANRNLYARGAGDPMESHTVRNKARIATIFAAAEGRNQIIDDDVELAEYLIQLSRKTYKSTIAELAKAHAEGQALKGKSDGIRGHHGDLTKREMNVRHHAKRIQEGLLKLCGNEAITLGQLRTVYKNNFNSGSREFWAEAIQHLSKSSPLTEQLKNLVDLEEQRQEELESKSLSREQ